MLTQRNHGESKNRTPEYVAWTSMRQRCLDAKCTSYHYYGGRGITICERWNSYQVFLADVGRRPSPDHTLDRIDNSGNYEPGNVRWATRLEQSRNRRIPRVDSGPRECMACGVSLPHVKPSELKRGRGRYCSRSCAATVSARSRH